MNLRLVKFLFQERDLVEGVENVHFDVIITH